MTPITQQEAQKTQPENLTARLIPGPPPSLYYIPNFVNASEEASILSSVYSVPLPQWRQLSNRRLQSLPSPLTTQNVLLDTPLPDWLKWPAERITRVRMTHEVSGISSLSSKGLFDASPHKAPNHCLVNEYKPGQGIMPHEDGPAYYPITATVSLGGHAVLEVRMKKDHDGNEPPGPSGEGEMQQQVWRILCEPRSLLVTMDEAYACTLHAIEGLEVDEDILEPRRTSEAEVIDKQGIGVANWDLLGDRDGWVKDGGRRKRETRVSLTYRDVLKVKSLKAFGALKGFGKK